MSDIIIRPAVESDIPRREALLYQVHGLHAEGRPDLFIPGCKKYTAEQLRAVSGSFTPSPFVQSVTGVDNVCERAAVLASGGVLYLPKWARDGVTFAVAVPSFAPNWRWRNEP